MGQQTPFLGMSYPNENDDPYFEQIRSFFTQIDANIFALLAVASQPVLGGGEITFSGSDVAPYLGVMQWTEPFEIPILNSGFFMQAFVGPDGENPQIQLDDGDRVVMIVQVASAGNVVASIGKVNGPLNQTTTPSVPNVFTLAFYRNGRLYLNIPQSLP